MKKTAAISTADRFSSTRKLTLLALLSAIAFITAISFRVPVISFLKYEPKDIFILFGGFLYGPVAALICSVVAAVLELPFSTTGLIGMIMNILSSASFACTASFLYKKRKDMYSAAIGLVCGVVAMSVSMLLWNYAISPLYMGVTREQIVPMLSTVFLPFNLLKAGINAGFTLLFYRPFLRIMQLCGFSVKEHMSDKKSSIILVASIAFVVLAICVSVVIFLNQK